MRIKDIQMLIKKNNNRKAERGSALVYILIAIALLGALTVTFMEPSSQQTSSQSGFRTVTAVKSQIDVIRSAVQECVLRYSNGDQTAAIQTSDSGANQIYPLKPNSTYLASPTVGTRLVKDLKCPGNQGSTVNDHQPIFGGSTGKFLQPPPDLFEDWQWYNGDDGVFFWTRTSKSDAFLTSALQKIDENFSECEADMVDASGGDVDMDSDATSQAVCPDGSVCYRVWMINLGTAPHGDYNVDNSCGASQT
tara:strand:+ start:5931 stop:6680 length:750 start_codon:yes stop_codon:yes gene_type:complete